MYDSRIRVKAVVLMVMVSLSKVVVVVMGDRQLACVYDGSYTR